MLFCVVCRLSVLFGRLMGHDLLCGVVCELLFVVRRALPAVCCVLFGVANCLLCVGCWLLIAVGRCGSLVFVGVC